MNNNDNYALYENGSTVLIRNLNPRDKIKFVGGFWRIQNDFSKPTKIIRDKEFVITEKLDIKENNKFTYHKANLVGINCYGKFESQSNFIIVNYENYWAYGVDLPSARAFLGNKLFNLFRDTIYQKITKSNQKFN